MVDYSVLREWRTQLRDDGETALRGLLEGRASLDSLTSADPDNAVHAILHLDGYDPDVARGLDHGCLSLAREFQSTLPHRKGTDYRIGVLRLATLITIVRRMLPERTVSDFHRNSDTWGEFFGNFVIDRSLDLRRRFYNILAFSQDIAAKNGLDPRRLEPLWLSLCSQSGDSACYNTSYLEVAMLGLRRLPLGDELGGNADSALRGLARWAAAQRPSVEDFEDRWRDLQRGFPPGSVSWQERVNHAIADVEQIASGATGGHSVFPLAQWWRDHVDVEMRPGGSNSRPNKQFLDTERSKSVPRGLNVTPASSSNPNKIAGARTS